MTTERIDPVSIEKRDETFIRGRPDLMPRLAPGNQLVAYISPDKQTDYVPVICETLADMQKVYSWYYSRTSSNIIWGDCVINEHLANRRRVNDISQLFR